jgi:hypothetical protein
MPSSEFSKLVIAGLKKAGMPLVDVARITGLTEARIEKVLAKKATLTHSQMDAIERATGRSAGQLAISGAGIKDKRLTSLIDALAECHENTRDAAALAKHC